MIVIGNYSIIQYAEANKIVICLPQTENSASNTITPIENRRYKLTNKELERLLLYVIGMFVEDKDA